MTTIRMIGIVLAAALCVAAAPQDIPHLVVYEGTSGPGVGKHIVFIAGDHEYRSEEILPAWARIMARNFGFTCSVFFTLDEQGFIEPGSSNIAGLESLRDADLLVVGLRFQDFPEDQMQQIVDYLDRGGPVIGIKTSTHAFRIEEGPFVKYTWSYEGEDYEGGFGDQVLGETWVGHHGTNHRESTRITVVPDEADHAIVRGVGDMHVVSGAYQAYPPDDATVLAFGQPLAGMEADASPADKVAMPVAWTRTYAAADGSPARVFTSTPGASQDFLDEDFRRMMINASLWALGMEDVITADLDVDLVGPYHPVEYSFDGYRLGVRPRDMAGWDTPIMDPSKPTGERRAPESPASLPGQGGTR